MEGIHQLLEGIHTCRVHAVMVWSSVTEYQTQRQEDMLTQQVCLLTVLEQWIRAGEFRQIDSLRVIEWLGDEVICDRYD